MNTGEVIYTVLEVLIAVCCCLGNMLVVLALWKTKGIQQPTFCLIVSLAVADFLVGFVAIPMAVLVNGRLETSFQTQLIRRMSCVLILLTLVSILCLMAIAIDRFLRVYIPLRYKRTVTWKHSYSVAAACWLVATPLSFTPMFGWHRDPPDSHSTDVCRFIDVIPMSYMVYFSFVLCNLMPLLVMIVLYSCIFCFIHGRLKEKPGNGAQNQSHIYLQKEKQLASSLALVLTLFVVSWLPIHIMNIVVYFHGPDTVPKIAFYVGILLSHANSAVNPVVYAFKIKKIKTAYVKIWRQFVLFSAENQGSSVSQTAENASSNMRSGENETTLI